MTEHKRSEHRFGVETHTVCDHDCPACAEESYAATHPEEPKNCIIKTRDGQYVTETGTSWAKVHALRMTYAEAEHAIASYDGDGLTLIELDPNGNALPLR